MNFLGKTVAVLALAASGLASADEAQVLGKVKTGILPSGEFYGIYQVQCDDSVSTSIVSLQGRSRWCAGEGGQLNCFRRSQEASLAACSNFAQPDSADRAGELLAVQ